MDSCPCFLLPGLHFGYPFLTHSHIFLAALRNDWNSKRNIVTSRLRALRRGQVEGITPTVGGGRFVCWFPETILKEHVGVCLLQDTPQNGFPCAFPLKNHQKVVSHRPISQRGGPILNMGLLVSFWCPFWCPKGGLLQILFRNHWHSWDPSDWGTRCEVEPPIEILGRCGDYLASQFVVWSPVVWWLGLAGKSHVTPTRPRGIESPHHQNHQTKGSLSTRILKMPSQRHANPAAGEHMPRPRAQLRCAFWQT